MSSLIDRLVVVSGGQSGVDTVGLQVAREFGVRTGGVAPHGWWRYSDDGALTRAPALLRSFGLVEGPPDPKRWVLRTLANARDSDFTVWFGDRSPGYWCTSRGCRIASRPLLADPHAYQIADRFRLCLRSPVAPDGLVRVNVAGNRCHTNPSASDRARAVLAEFLDDLRRFV